ncbi:MAG: hypothetical protein K9M11_02760 [Candidatus Pacebacteria bacterium]|nr:hypothetical protein [Candidatus Paceibacterota bacterium]
MEKYIKIADKIVLAHKGFWNRESTNSYIENSKEVCSISNTKDYVSIIELDIRKSKDGVLYCYHGTLFQYYITLKFRKNLSFLKQKYNADSLADVLGVISPNKAIFMDIKDSSITKEDILEAFQGKVFREIILANKSKSFLDRFSNMPKGYVKIMNGNIFCNFYDLKKLRDKDYKYFEVVFPFQVHANVIERVHKVDMEFRCSGLFFISQKSYWNKISKYNIKHISSDFI